MDTKTVLGVKRAKIDFDSITEKDWERYLRYFKSEHKRLRPDDPLEPDEVMKKRIHQQMNDPQMILDVESLEDPESGEMVGMYIYGTPTKDHPIGANNPSLGFVVIELIPEFRRRGIARILLEDALEKLDRDGKTVVFGSTNQSDGAEFVKHIGGQVGQVNIVNRVAVKDIDMDMMREWVRVGRERSPKTRLEFYWKIPDALAEEYCRTYEATVNQVPRDNLEFNDMRFSVEDLRKQEKERDDAGVKVLTAVTIEPDGEASALTELTFSPTNPTRLSQGLTGTLEKHRGRGLGKWIKAAMILRAVEEFPNVEFITTGNATTNAPMLSINERIGFKKYRENYGLQITRDTIAKYLKKE